MSHRGPTVYYFKGAQSTSLIFQFKIAITDFLSCASPEGLFRHTATYKILSFSYSRGFPASLYCPFCNAIKLYFQSVEGFQFYGVELYLNWHKLPPIFFPASHCCEKYLFQSFILVLHLDHLLKHSQPWTNGISHVSGSSSHTSSVHPFPLLLV